MSRYQITCLLIIASILMLGSQGAYKGKNAYGVDIFTVDLDLPEQQRFVEVSTYYKTFVLEVLDQYLALIPAPVLFIVDQVGAGLYWLHPEYYMEVEGMAQAIGVSTNSLLLAQYINEFSAFCTSVVAYNADNTVFHGRNMDFLFETTMRNITYQGEFYRNGSYLFTAVMYSGLNGVHTGWRNGWSVSINNRRPSFRTNPIYLLENIGMILLGYTQNMKLIRDTLQTCDDYSCALDKLSTTPQIAPSYYAVAGNETYQGAIITRDRFGPAHIDLLSKENWYIVQTNDDHWTGACNLRCSYVKDSLNKIGRSAVHQEDLRNILLQWPSNNAHSIYNTLITPKDRFFEVQTIANDKPAPN